MSAQRASDLSFVPYEMFVFTWRTLLVFFSLITILAFFGQNNPLLEMLSYFRVVYAVGLAILAGLLYLSQQNGWAKIAFVMFIINFVFVAQFVVPPLASILISSNKTQHFLFYQANVHGGSNSHWQETLDAIRGANPDIIGLSELTKPLLNFLGSNLRDYPYTLTETNYGGIAVFSRIPWTIAEVKYFGSAHCPRIIAKLLFGSEPISLIFAHPGAMFHDLNSRNAEIKLIAQEAKEAGGSAIVAGDLNCSPWSSCFGEFKEIANLEDSELGYGFQPTWPAMLPFPLVPVDHCLITKDLVVLKRYLGRKIGSSHLPVLTEIGLRVTGGRT